MAFRHLIEFTYTAKLMIQGEEEANDVWKAAEFLQMLEAIKALEVRYLFIFSGMLMTLLLKTIEYVCRIIK